MIDATPQTDSNTEVQKGDKIRTPPWLLNASVDPSDVTLTVRSLNGDETTYSGDEIEEEEVVDGDERYWRYYKDIVLPSIRTTFEWELDDPVNDAHDFARITAER